MRVALIEDHLQVIDAKAAICVDGDRRPPFPADHLREYQLASEVNIILANESYHFPESVRDAR
jgi:hypothetical protein